MSQKPPQNYANHAKMVPLFHYVTFGILGINLVVQLVQLYVALTREGGGWPWGYSLLGVAMSAALLLLAWYARTFALTVQNRIIRLEERIRLTQLLPEDLRGRIGELTIGQLVGLRFASDGEVAGLVRRVIAGELKTNDQVKRAIGSWREDHLRA